MRLDVPPYLACLLAALLLIMLAFLVLRYHRVVVGRLGLRCGVALVWGLSAASALSLLASHALCLGETRTTLDWAGPLRAGVDLLAVAVVLIVLISAALVTIALLPRGRGQGMPVLCVAAPLSALACWVPLSVREPVSPRTMLAVAVLCVACAITGLLLGSRRRVTYALEPAVDGALDAGNGPDASGRYDAAKGIAALSPEAESTECLRHRGCVLDAALGVAVLIVVCALWWLGVRFFEVRTPRPVEQAGEVDRELFEFREGSAIIPYVVLGVSCSGDACDRADVYLAIDPGVYDYFVTAFDEEEILAGCSVSEDASVTYALYDSLCLSEVSPDEVGGDRVPDVPDCYLLGYIF